MGRDPNWKIPIRFFSSSFLKPSLMKEHVYTVIQLCIATGTYNTRHIQYKKRSEEELQRNKINSWVI